MRKTADTVLGACWQCSPFGFSELFGLNEYIQYVCHVYRWLGLKWQGDAVMLEYFFFVCLGAVLALYLIGLPVDVSLLQGCFLEINNVLCDVVFGSFKKGVIHLCFHNIQSLFVSFLNLLNGIPFSLFTAVANSIFSHLLKRFLKELRQLNHIFVFMYQTTSFINELISRETWEKNWSSTRAFLNDTSAYLVERFDGIKAIAYNIDYVFENYLLIPLNNNITLFIEDIVNELTGVRGKTRCFLTLWLFDWHPVWQQIKICSACFCVHVPNPNPFPNPTVTINC